MRHIGFIMEDGFQIMAMAASSAFEFANIQSGEKLYRVSVMSEKGGPIRS
ncbi:MAG: GlxA family transcriptional regulator, partial [Bradyrhizobium sp.]|nr:GlxA family transcriptional regulator [Bradyrhizobium sp.]